MEATTTTMNISVDIPRTSDRELLRHSHGPNFGRYVEGCARCVQINPDGPPKNGYAGKTPRKRLNSENLANKAKEVLEAKLTETEQRMADMIAKMEAAQKRAEAAEAAVVVKEDPLNSLVQLMMRREAKTMAKEEDTEARRESARQDMLKVTREGELQKQNRQANCRHVKENGRTAINGQVHNDGLYHPICFHCFKEFDPVQPGRDMMSNGMQAI